MSGLLFQNSNNKCAGWVNPNALQLGPQIDTLSSFFSPAASNSLVVIVGTNFYSYSSVHFSTYTPTVYFINSSQIEFYVPQSLTSGVYSIQVFNGSYASNIVNYTIDNASGFWIKNANGTISNSNFSNTGTGGGLAINGNVKINGNLTCTGSINPYTPSDYRIKNVLESLTIGSNYSVDNLKPVKYINTNTGTIEMGFLAHEVQQEFPFLVTGQKDGEQIQTLNYTGIIALLVKEIQQLKTDVININLRKQL
jgi:hypothetical protein